MQEAHDKNFPVKTQKKSYPLELLIFKATQNNANRPELIAELVRVSPNTRFLQNNYSLVIKSLAQYKKQDAEGFETWLSQLSLERVALLRKKLATTLKVMETCKEAGVDEEGRFFTSYNRYLAFAGWGLVVGGAIGCAIATGISLSAMPPIAIALAILNFILGLIILCAALAVISVIGLGIANGVVSAQIYLNQKQFNSLEDMYGPIADVKDLCDRFSQIEAPEIKNDRIFGCFFDREKGIKEESVCLSPTVSQTMN